MKRGILLVSIILLISIVVAIFSFSGVVAYAKEDNNYLIYTAKAYADKIGGHIEIYANPKPTSEIITTYLDGTRLAVMESEVEGYHVVIMEDGLGYVKNENLTTTLSYNERVAIVIGLIAVITVALILLITYYRRNREYFKNKHR